MTASWSGVAIRTSRFDAMLEFYRSRLGLSFERQGTGVAVHEFDGWCLRIEDDPGRTDGESGLSIRLKVRGGVLDRERARRGVPIEDDVVLRDPDGNALSLACCDPADPGPSGDGSDAELGAWLERAEPGWSEVFAPRALTAATFLSGDPDGDRLRIRYFKRLDDGAVMGKVWYGPLTQGPPGHAHGGSIASLLDEAMGGACWTSGYPVLAGELTTRFRKMLPLNTRCVVEARVTEAHERKVMARADLHSVDGTHFADASGLFVRIDRERFGPLIRQVGAFFGPKAGAE